MSYGRSSMQELRDQAREDERFENPPKPYDETQIAVLEALADDSQMMTQMERAKLMFDLCKYGSGKASWE